MAQEIFYHFQINFSFKISSKSFFENWFLKSEYPLNRDSLNKGFLTLKKPKKIWDQTVLSPKCGYPLNRGATKVGFHCIDNMESESESIQLSRICIKNISNLFYLQDFSKSTRGMILCLLHLCHHTLPLDKTGEKPTVI